MTGGGAGEDGAEVTAPSRGSSLSPQDFYLLDQWGRALTEAFVETPYFVGSACRGARDYRDVDVRMLLPEDATWDDHALRTINMALTLWGRKVTGLPIDFQMQRPDDFHQYDSERRSALGIRTRVWVQEARDARAQ